MQVYSEELNQGLYLLQKYFLESAYFNPVAIVRHQKAGLKTDASFRFEEALIRYHHLALKRAIMLIKELAGGEFI